MVRASIQFRARRAALGLVPLLLGALVSCAGQTQPQQESSAPTTPKMRPGASGTTVHIKSYEFNPAVLEVKAGATVTWVNDDDARHTVNSGAPDAPQDAPLKGEVDAHGGQYTATLAAPGEYNYYCNRHKAMKGKIVVK